MASATRFVALIVGVAVLLMLTLITIDATLPAPSAAEQIAFVVPSGNATGAEGVGTAGSQLTVTLPELSLAATPASL